MSRNLHYILPLTYILAISFNVYVTNAKEKLQGIFVFGSSVADNGNNNYNGMATGDYLPYGIDFANGPTGRYSNGKNVVDQISDLLSLHPVTSFLAMQKNNGSAIINGVNMASGASGILEETSALMGVKSVKHQVNNFRTVVLPQLEEQLGNSRTNILGEYLFVLAAGDHDYSSYQVLHQDLLWNHLVFAAKLVSSYFGQLKTLYRLGARKFLLLSVYPVGCNPVLTKGGRCCIKHLNAAVDVFYDQLVVMVMQSKQEMPDAQFCAVNTAKIIKEAIKTKNNTGFVNVNTPCCETTVEGTCKKGGKVCKNRKEHVYFDGLHLTEAASEILADKAFYSKDNSHVYPTNLQVMTHTT